MATMNTIIMHLSDIHFHHPGLLGERLDLDTDLRNELETDAATMKARLGPVAAILVNGDIAFSGHAEEYGRAKRWLDALCVKLDCPPERVFTTPGNHDVNRQEIKASKFLRLFHEDIRGRKVEDLDTALAEYLEDSVARHALFLPIAAYNDFAAPYGCALDAESPYWEYPLILNDGSTLQLRGVNSTLVSDESDNDTTHKLVLGSIQTSILRQTGVEYLVLCHHPLQWLRDEDEVNEALNARARIQLYGHKHKQHAYIVDQRVLRIAAGAVQPDRREPNWQPRYNYLKVWVDGSPTDRRLAIDLYPRVWNKELRRFGADYAIDGSDKKSARFPLPDWEGPHQPVVFAHEGTQPETAPERDGGEETVAPPQREEERVDPDRRLTYRFLSLPYQRRLAVAEQVGLVKDGDQYLTDMNRYRAFFGRAREGGRLADLWMAVEQNFDDGRIDPNPFVGR